MLEGILDASPDSPELISIKATLAAASFERGDYVRAEALEREALAAARKVLGPGRQAPTAADGLDAEHPQRKAIQRELDSLLRERTRKDRGR